MKRGSHVLRCLFLKEGSGVEFVWSDPAVVPWGGPGILTRWFLAKVTRDLEVMFRHLGYAELLNIANSMQF